MRSETVESPVQMLSQEIKTHVEALPTSEDQLIGRVKRIVSLPGVQRITISGSSIEVIRACMEGEAVIPADIPDEVVDVMDLVNRVPKDDEPYDPETHPYLTLYSATDRISKKNLSVTHIIAPEGEWLAAWLGLDTNIVGGSKVFGIRVVYTDNQLMEGKVVVLGSPNPSGILSDASYGVIIDMGID